MEENNKLIAEFMGTTYKQKKNTHGVVLYKVSWDWLMPVVEKCLILTCDNDWHEWDLSIAETLRAVDKKTVYEEVVEFIKFYNSLTHS
jgi:hypothetical protein